jgi:hypothetical protein
VEVVACYYGSTDVAKARGLDARSQKQGWFICTYELQIFLLIVLKIVGWISPCRITQFLITY